MIQQILLQYNHSKSYYGIPRDSASGVPPWVFGLVLLIAIYVAMRVWWRLRKEHKSS